MQLITEVSGLLASITGFLVWLPQARRVWQDRHDPERLSGVSLQTQALSLAGNVLWLVHAVGIGSFWLGAPSVVNIPVIVLTIALVRRAQRTAATSEALLALVPVEEEPAEAVLSVVPEAAPAPGVDSLPPAEEFAPAV